MPASGIRRVDIVDIAWIIKYVGGTLAMQGGAQRAHPTDMGDVFLLKSSVTVSQSLIYEIFPLVINRDEGL
jgi:hypothetical protein